MKIWEWIKIIGINKIYKEESTTYKIELNNEELEDIKVYSNILHSKTYKILRTFKTSQYNDFYLMRNKKGFNTLFFNIAYDILIADKDGKILDFFKNKNQGYISKYYNNSYFILFLPVGTINFYSFQINDKINLIRDWRSKKALEF